MKKIFSKITKERKYQFQIETGILLENDIKYVEKKGLNVDSRKHVQNMYNVYEEYLDKGITNLNKCDSISEGQVRFEFIKGISLNQKMIEAVTKRDRERVKKLVSEYANFVNVLSSKVGTEEFDNSKEFIDVFGDGEKLKGVAAAKKLVFDLTFENLIDDGEKYQIIDYEWCFDFLVPVEFVVYRAMFGFYTLHGKLFEGFISREEFLDIAGISGDIAEYYFEKNEFFIDYVYGQGSYEEILKSYRKINADITSEAVRQRIFVTACESLGYVEDTPYDGEKKNLDAIVKILEKHGSLFDDAGKFFKITQNIAKDSEPIKKTFLDNEFFGNEMSACLEDILNTVTYYRDMAEKKDEICTELINEKQNIDNEVQRLSVENEKLKQELEYIRSSKIYKMGLKNKTDKFRSTLD